MQRAGATFTVVLEAFNQFVAFEAGEEPSSNPDDISRCLRISGHLVSMLYRT